MRVTNVVMAISMVSACGSGPSASDAGASDSGASDAAGSDAEWPAHELVCAARAQVSATEMRIVTCTDYEGPSSPAVCGYGDRIARCPAGPIARCDYTPSADGTTLVVFTYPPADVATARMFCTTGTLTAL